MLALGIFVTGMASPETATTFRRLANVLGPFFGLLFVIGLFSLDSTVRPSFLTGANAKIILTQTVIVAIGTLGMTIIIVSGGIDLSVGSIVALTSVVCALALDKGRSPWTAALLTIGTGALVGLINGSIIGFLRMMPFIVTLGMMGIGRGTAKWLSDSQTVNPPENPLNDVMAFKNPDYLLPVPRGVWITLELAVIMAIIMRGTVFGRYIFAIGANEAAARLSGIRVQLHKTAIYVLAGVFFGIAGLMQFSRLTQGD